MTTTQKFTVDDLKRILRESAGEGAGLDGDILDTDFEVLGYESLALLETGGRIELEYEIELDDSALTDAATPRELVDIVNNHLSPVAEAA